MTDLQTSIKIDLAGNLERRAQRYSDALGRFSRRGTQQLGFLTRSANSLGRALEMAGGRYSAALVGAATTYKATRAVMDSAALDKQLIQIAQTAGATAGMAKILRTELHTMAQETGQDLNSLLMGFNNLVQAGLSWEEALATITAINPAMAVTGANADTLASALTVAGEAFDFDLSNVETARDLLDQMVVAGRLGNAELEDLSGIFARVGVNAKAANLSFSQTLGFIEQLSLIERDPQRLATLADSTLRLFTNQRYLEKAASVTGVSFYDSEGGRRGAFDVLSDIARKYQTLGTDVDRDKALSAAFEGADLDTLKGLRLLLGGDALFKVRSMTEEIQNASGALAKDLPGAIDNSVDQVARLKASLRAAADEFARPVNDAVNDGIRFLLDEQGLSGKQILAGGAAGAAGLLLGAKFGGKLLQRVGSTAGGLAVGKALEETAGVTPVYVVNMPGAGMGGVAAAGGKGFGRFAGTAGRAGLVGLAGLGGYGIGSLANNQIDSMFTNALGRDESLGTFIASLMEERDGKLSDIGKVGGAFLERSTPLGLIRILIDNEGKPRVTEVSAAPGVVDMEVESGSRLGEGW